MPYGSVINEILLQMEWNPPKFKILGIWFTNDLKECEVFNFSELFFLFVFFWKYELCTKYGQRDK